ncbi:MAG: lysozyme [Pseudomonadota bacterium]
MIETDSILRRSGRLPIVTALISAVLAACSPPAPDGGDSGQDEASLDEVMTLEEAFTVGIFFDETREVLRADLSLRPVNQNGIDLTKLSEGFVGRLYHDAAGYCTIAYGHLLRRANCTLDDLFSYPRGISLEDGEAMLVEDMRFAQIAVLNAVRQPLNDNQYAALCDFAFNVGGRNFRNSTLLKRINAGRMQDVPYELRRWVYAGGKKLEGLKNRREREIALFFKDQAVPRSAAKVTEADIIDIRNGEPG